MKKVLYYIGFVLFIPVFFVGCVIVILARIILSFGYSMVGNWKQAKTIMKNLFRV